MTHMHSVDDWPDVIRVMAFLLNVWSLVMAVQRYRRSHKDWSTKTIDLWYALTFWVLAGAVFCIQGIMLDRPFTVGFVFLTAATLVTGKGLHSKGNWGGKDA